SLAASFLFLFLWTDPVIMRALGVGATYASLLAFSVFPNAFSVVLVQTEPLTFLFTLGAFLAFARGHLLLAGALAGAAAGMRVSGAGVGVALGLAILVHAYYERPQRARDWAVVLISALLSGWGLMVMMGYHWWRFGDPLLYVHAHAQTYGHSGSVMNLI